MSWTDFQKLLATFGAPGALMAVFIWSLHKSWIRLGRETAEKEEERGRERKEWERERSEMVSRYEELKIEKNMWRDLAVKNAFTVERATDIAHTAMNAKGEIGNTKGKD